MVLGQVVEDLIAPSIPQNVRAVVEMDIVVGWASDDPSAMGFRIYDSTNLTTWKLAAELPVDARTWQTRIDRSEPSRFFQVTSTNEFGESSVVRAQ